MFSYMFSCYPGEKCKKICNKKKKFKKDFHSGEKFMQEGREEKTGKKDRK